MDRRLGLDHRRRAEGAVRRERGLAAERRVLLPGVTTLVRLVASRRTRGTQRLWEILCDLLTDAQELCLTRCWRSARASAGPGWTRCAGAVGALTTVPVWLLASLDVTVPSEVPPPSRPCSCLAPPTSGLSASQASAPDDGAAVCS